MSLDIETKISLLKALGIPEEVSNQLSKAVITIVPDSPITIETEMMVMKKDNDGINNLGHILDTYQLVKNKPVDSKDICKKCGGPLVRINT